MSRGETLGMPEGRDQIVKEIEASWSELKAAIAQVPADRMEGPPVVGDWTVKDFLGHIATWEAEAMGNIERFMDPHIGTMYAPLSRCGRVQRPDG